MNWRDGCYAEKIEKSSSMNSIKRFYEVITDTRFLPIGKHFAYIYKYLKHTLHWSFPVFCFIYMRVCASKLLDGHYNLHDGCYAVRID